MASPISWSDYVPCNTSILTVAQLHPVLVAFFWFYCAISYESIGLISHDYSNNKLRFLERANESFNTALRKLPLPYVSTEAGAYEQAEHSPLPSVLATPLVHYASSRGHAAPATRIVVAGIGQSASAYSIYSTESPVSEPYPAPDADMSSSSKVHNPITPRAQGEIRSTKSSGTTIPLTPATHKSRLSQSLSLEHQLADELVPSPLFSRKPKQARITDPDESVAAVRPLPPLPFNHQSDFELRGCRIAQVPAMRKTAVQTIIARYEGSFPSPESIESPSPSSAAAIESPVTPRFKAIRDAFAPNPVNVHLDAYLASPDLNQYNTCLADFRLQLRNHITYLEREITRVHEAQDERTAAKALSKSSFASFWSFEQPICSPKRKSPGARDDIEASDSASAHGEDEHSKESRGRVGKERIERLRLDGWQVRKEEHGYKGSDWYEGLASRVESELSATAAKRAKKPKG